MPAQGTSDADYLFDVFIAHASADKPYCEELATAFEHAGVHAFLDARNLDAASQWHRELPHAQRQSRVTLVVVTEHTPHAWYQNAEIARAIAQQRFGDRQHEVVPLWRLREKPYGTETLVGIELRAGEDGLAHVVGEVLRLLRDRFALEVGDRFSAHDLPRFMSTGLLRPPKRDGSPTELLVAGRQVVAFVGRDDQLRALHAWADEPGPSVKLIHGPGGAGKTRVVLQWLRERRDRGDVAGLLRGDSSASVAEQLLHRSGRTVLAIDYAETRRELRTLVAPVAEAWERGAGPHVKVLLVARHDGEWWGALKEDGLVRSFLADDNTIRLDALSDVVDRREEFVRAAAAFADHLGTTRPAPPADLEAVAYERPLFVHIAALLGALGHPSAKVGDLLDGLLDRERAFWRRHCADGSIDWTEREHAFERALAALTLRGGAPDRGDLDPWLPTVAGIHTDAFRRLVVQHYEGSPERWRDPLQPDIVGEHLVWLACRGGRRPTGRAPAADLVEQAMVDSRGPWSAAFTVLARAEPDHPDEIADWLDALLAPDITGRALAALDGALAAGQRTAFSTLGIVLATRLRTCNDAVLAREVSSRIPAQVVGLREVAVWAEQTILDVGELEDAELARVAHNLGNRLSKLGRPEEALDATQRAVDLRERLAASRPDAFLPGHAQSLNSLGNRLSELGRREEALDATQRAVDAYQRLAASGSDAFLPDLARSLNNLGIMLSALGRREEALAATQPAVDAYQRLVMSRPDAFLPDLAASLNNLGVRLSALGRREDALGATQRAVDAYQRLATSRPDSFLPDLAMSLNSLGNRLSQLGRREDALDATQRAVDVRERLAASRPDAFLPDLAASLNNLGITLSDLGRHEEALDATQRAVDAYQRLAASRPDAFLPDLAMSLQNLGVTLSDLGRGEDALVPTQRAVDVYQRLAASRPDAFLPDLAGSLNSLGNRLSKLGRPEEALDATLRAVDLRERLAASRPDAFLPDLAGSLNNLGNRLSALGRREEALDATLRAVDLRERLAASRPDAFLPDLAGSLHNLSVRLSDVGRREEALDAALRVVDAYERLAASRPDAFLPDLARSLNNLGIALSEMGRREEALDATRRAVHVRERLAASRPDAFFPDLAVSLSNLGIMLSKFGRREEAVDATQRAVDAYQRLAEPRPDAFLPDLAMSLSNLGIMLSELGRHEEARDATQRAAHVRERLGEP